MANYIDLHICMRVVLAVRTHYSDRSQRPHVSYLPCPYSLKTLIRWLVEAVYHTLASFLQFCAPL